MKKFLALVTAMMLLLVLSSCSSSDDKENKQPEKSIGRSSSTVNKQEETSLPDEETVTAAPEEAPETEPVSVKDETPEPESSSDNGIDPRAGHRGKSKNWEYLIREDGTACVFCYDVKQSKKKDITIPSELDGLPVTATEGLMFYASSGVESVTIPTSIIHMDSNPVHNAYSCHEINVEPGHPFLEVIDGVLFDKEQKRLVAYPIGLRDKLDVLEYTVPDGTVIIGGDAFSNVSLRRIHLPDSIRVLDEGAFVNTDLEEIILPDGLAEINGSAFYGCEGLKEVKIPDGITCIRDSTFKNCTSLKKMVVPGRVETIENEAFAYCINLETITIPSSVSHIGKNVFMDCDKLIVQVEKGSYAEQYCIKNNLNYTYVD